MNILSENVGRYKMVFRLFSFSACNPAKTEVSYDTTEGGIELEKDSALYQLMDTRMHSGRHDGQPKLPVLIVHGLQFSMCNFNLY